MLFSHENDAREKLNVTVDSDCEDNSNENSTANDSFTTASQSEVSGDETVNDEEQNETITNDQSNDSSEGNPNDTARGNNLDETTVPSPIDKRSADRDFKSGSDCR